MARKIKDLTGMRFGRLLVIGGRTCDKHGNAAWDCLCDCGNITHPMMQSLRSGCTQSCGCLNREITADRNRVNTEHGLAKDPLYNTWRHMIDRCTNEESPAYKNYGGRGITVCEEWKSLSSFVRDMSPKPYGHELDRIDNNLGYFKENCRWVTKLQNARNKRSNVLVELDGVLMPLSQAAEMSNVNYKALHARYTKGLTQEGGLFSPSRATS